MSAKWWQEIGGLQTTTIEKDNEWITQEGPDEDGMVRVRPKTREEARAICPELTAFVDLARDAFDARVVVLRRKGEPQ